MTTLRACEWLAECICSKAKFSRLGLYVVMVCCPHLSALQKWADHRQPGPWRPASESQPSSSREDGRGWSIVEPTVFTSTSEEFLMPIVKDL